MSTDDPTARLTPDVQALRDELTRVDQNTNVAWTKIEQLVDRIDELETTVENLQAAVETLEDRAPDPNQKQYQQMDRADKATVVRSKLKDEATSTNGKAATTYKGVIRIFDGQPSAGHAYSIMETAAEVDGYEYGISPDGTKRLTYDHTAATAGVKR